MSIRMAQAYGFIGPHILCDHCVKEIIAGDGICYWRTIKPDGQTVHPFFVHNICQEAFVQQRSVNEWTWVTIKKFVTLLTGREDHTPLQAGLSAEDLAKKRQRS